MPTKPTRAFEYHQWLTQQYLRLAERNLAFILSETITDSEWKDYLSPLSMRQSRCLWSSKEEADLVKRTRCVLKDDANPTCGKDTMQERRIANSV